MCGSLFPSVVYLFGRSIDRLIDRSIRDYDHGENIVAVVDNALVN